MDAKNAPQIIEHISQNVAFTPFESRWIPMSARFVVMGNHAKGTGAMVVYSMDNGKLRVEAEAEPNEGIKCGTFGASMFEKRQLATGSLKGQLNIWDVENLKVPIYSAQAHQTMVNCIDGIGGLNVGYGAPELVTGGRDGSVKVWDPRQKADPVASMDPAPGQKARDCWAVAFGNSFDNDNRCVAAGYDNGDVKILDLRTNKLLWETNVRNGVVALQFDRLDIEMNKLVVAQLESRFSVFDMRTSHHTDGFASLTEPAHKSTVWCVRHTPQNRDLFMTTGAGTLNLYKYNYPAQRSIKDELGFQKGVVGTVSLLNSRRFSDQPIVSIDWHPERAGLFVATALDQSVKVGIVTKINLQ